MTAQELMDLAERGEVEKKYISGEYVWHTRPPTDQESFLEFTCTRIDGAREVVRIPFHGGSNFASLTKSGQDALIAQRRIQAGVAMLKRPFCSRCAATGQMTVEVRRECAECKGTGEVIISIASYTCPDCNGAGYSSKRSLEPCDGGSFGVCPCVHKTAPPTKPSTRRKPLRFSKPATEE